MKRDPRYVAVIDIGKTNAKVAVVDMAAYCEIAVRSMPNRILRDGPYPHFDTSGLWRFILDALTELRREHAIEAVTATTHGACCALLGGNGDLAMPVLDYEHSGPDELAADYDAERPDFAETGSPRLPIGLNLGAQLYWLHRRFPDAFARVSAILTWPQYWTWRLTGTPSCEATSLGCHTDLWSPAARSFSSLAERLSWRPLFAPLRKASDTLGTVSQDVEACTGLGPETPVHCGIHDSNASLLPHLLTRKAPFAVVSTGTWVVAMAVGGKPARLDPARDTLINVSALGDPVPSARFMGGREHATLTVGLSGTPSEPDVAAVLWSHLLLLMPSVEGGCGPFPRRMSAWSCGQPLPPGQRQAAASFYLAMMTSVCLELVGADGVTVVEGPLAQDALYIRMLAAATGRAVQPVTTCCTGTSIGAAMLACSDARPPPPSEALVTNAAPEWVAYARAWRARAEGLQAGRETQPATASRDPPFGQLARFPFPCDGVPPDIEHIAHTVCAQTNKNDK
jgi:sugar (pentulose or hexulose) kinase